MQINLGKVLYCLEKEICFRAKSSLENRLFVQKLQEKPLQLRKILLLSSNCKESFSKSKQSLENCVTVKKLERKLFQKEARSKEFCYFLENTRKTTSKQN